MKKIIKSFPMVSSCSRKELCGVCENNGIKCASKRIVQKAKCMSSDKNNPGRYIGETSRQFGERVSKTKQRITPRSHLSSLDEGAQHRDGGTGFQVHNYQRT